MIMMYVLCDDVVRTVMNGTWHRKVFVKHIMGIQ
jgi:hypothetical protein